MDIRKLRTREPDEMQGEVSETVSDRPKRSRVKKVKEREKNPVSGALAVAVLVGIGILFVFSTFIQNEPQVKGLKTEEKQQALSKEASAAASTIRGRFEHRLESIKEQVAQLEPDQALTNAPQIEKLIHDLKALQGLPQESVENACHSICDVIDQR